MLGNQLVTFLCLHKENMKDPVTHKRAIDRYKEETLFLMDKNYF